MSELAGARQRPAPAAGSTITELLGAGVLDADLAALLWLLAEHGVPIVLAAPDMGQASRLRRAVAGMLSAERRSAEVVLPGGVVSGASFEEVVRLAGGQRDQPLPDEARDLGIVVVLKGDRVASAHYVRPLERDGAGHVQRRPPGLLSAWNEARGALDHFYWSITDELATRSGMTRETFERDHARRSSQLGGN